MAPRIALLVPMRVELAPVVKALRLQQSTLGDRRVFVSDTGSAQLVATRIGMGTEPARRATEWLLEQHPVDHALVVGVAGGVKSGLRIGDVFLPDLVVDAASGAEYRPAPLADVGVQQGGTLLTTDELLSGPDVLAMLRAREITALDMEASAVAAVCTRHAVPWSVVRSISDCLEDDLVDDAVFELTGADGRTDLRAVARLVVRRPRMVPTLARLGRDLRRATAAAADAAARACAALSRG